MKYISTVLFILFFTFSTVAQPFKIGDTKEGGIVFSIKGKTHGMVVSEKVLGAMSWDEGLKACDSLKLNGYEDWRLPTKKELAIIYYALYIQKYVTYPTGFYWSRTENKGISTLAWSFDFKDASEINSHSKNNQHFILAVRSF